MRPGRRPGPAANRPPGRAGTRRRCPRPAAESPPPAATREPRQHVPAAGRGQPWRPRRVDPHGTVTAGSATSVVDPFRSTVAPYRAGQFPHRSQPAPPPPAPAATPSSAAASPACGVISVGAVRARTPSRSRQPQPVGVDQHGNVRVQHSATVRGVVPGPGPTTQACTRPACAGPRSDTSVSGNRRAPRPRRDHVPHRPGPAPQRPRDGEHGGPRIPGRPGGDPTTPRRYLSLSPPGAGSSRPHRHAAGPPAGSAGSRSEPDVDEPHEPAYSRAGIDQQPRLVRAEGDGEVGPYRAPAHLAGVGVDAAGQVDGDDEGPRRSTRAATVRGLRPQPALAADPDDAVETRSARRDDGRRPGVGGATARRRPGRSAASPPAWARPGASSTAVTPAPRRASRAPAYRASPPLSPLPTSSTTRRRTPGPADRRRRRRARRRPAA